VLFKFLAELRGGTRRKKGEGTGREGRSGREGGARGNTRKGVGKVRTPNYEMLHTLYCTRAKC